MNPEFIITLIVRARNEIAAVMGKATKDVDKLTDGQERLAKSSKAVATESEKADKSVDGLRARYHAFTEEMKKGNTTTEESIGQLKRFTQEFDKLSRKAPAGSDTARELEQTARAVQRFHDDITTALKSEETSTKQSIKSMIEAEQQRVVRERQMAKERIDLEKQLTAETQAEIRRREGFEKAADRIAADRAKQASRDLEREVSDRIDAAARVAAQRKAIEDKSAKEIDDARKKIALDEIKAAGDAEQATLRQTAAQRKQRDDLHESIRAYEDFIDRVRTGEVAGENVRIGLQQHASTLGSRASRAEPGSSDALAAGGASQEARNLVKELDADVKRLGNDSNDSRGFLARLFDIDPGKLNTINGLLSDFESGANDAGFSAVRLAGNLRAMVIVALLGFFTQLIGAGIALGGTLVSLASAAVQAGGALGGALAAGAAQALPVIGLIGAAWGRVGAVFDALKQAQKAQTAAAFDNETAASRQRSAADALASAEEGVAAAHRRVTDAQNALSDARFQAKRQIEDLTNAERQAQLQAESAALAQTDAQKALQRTISGQGNIDDLAQQSIQARQTSLDVVTTGVGAARATFDATKARVGGVNAAPQVVAANKALADAVRGVTQANRALAAARASSDDTMRQMGTAERQLEQMLGRLSPAERRLYDVGRQIQKDYRQVFAGRDGILEPIIDAFTHGAKRLDALLHDNELIAAARSLAEGIGEQLRRISDFITGPQTTSFFADMAAEAKANLPTVVDILKNIVTLFENIAKAGSPALRNFLGFLKEITGEADRATGSKGGIKSLEDFFTRGEKYAESFIRLGQAIGNLFLAIIGTSADQGNDAVKSLTDSINGAADYIRAHHDDVVQFFRDAREASDAVLTAIWDLSKAIFNLFHQDQVKALADAFSTSLLPALVDILKVMGGITKLFLDFAGTDIGGAFVRLGLTMIGLRVALGPLLGLFAKLIIGLGTISGRVGLVRGGLVLLEIATGPVGIALAAIAAAFLVLSGRAHSTSDWLKAIVVTLGGMILLVSGPKGLVGAVGLLIKALGKIPGVGKLLGKIPGVSGIIAGGGTTAAVAGAEAAAGGAVLGPLTKAQAAKGLTRGSPLAGAGAAAAEGEGAAVGTAVGGAARVAAIGMLKKAGWIGLGISAGQGIISGFKHHSVTAGIQDFFHSVSFGLIKSVDEAGTEAGKRLIKKLSVGQNIDIRTPEQVSVDTPAQAKATPTRPRVLPSGGRGAGVNPAAITVPQGGADRNDFEDLQRAFPKIAKAIELYQTLRDKITIARKSGKPLTDALISEVSRFTQNAPPELKDAAAKMADSLGIFRDKAKNAEDAVKRLGDAVKTASKLGIPARNIGEFNTVLEGTAQRFKDLQTTGTDSLDQVQRVTETNTKTIKEVLGENSLAGTAALAANYHNAADAVKKSMDRAGKVTKEGMAKIRQLLKKALTTYGLSDEQAGNYLDNKTGDVAGKGSVGLPGSGQGGHTGGWLGMQGQRGGDGTGPFINGKATGVGEAVLAMPHQQALNSVLSRAKAFGQSSFGSVGELFNKVKGQHGPANGFRGLSEGGYVQDAAANGGAEHLVAAARSFASKMFKLGYSVTSAFRPGAVTSSGNPSQHGTGAALDFGDSVNNLSSLWKIVFPLRGQFNQLLGPQGLYDGLKRFTDDGLQEDHNNHIHVGFLDQVKGAIRGAANTGASAVEAVAKVIKHIKTPKIDLPGGLGQVVKQVMKQSTRAANAQLDRITGGPTATTAGFTDLSRAGLVSLNHVFKGHLTGTPGAQLSAAQVTKIAQSVGLPGRQFEQIAHGESNYMPGIVEKPEADGAQGYGLWQLTTGHVDAAVEALIKKLGGWAQMLNPFKNALAAKKLFDIGGIGRWFGTKYLKLAGGGAVNGPGTSTSDSIPARLSKGEHVWSAAEVARAGGHDTMLAMRRFFGGGKQAIGHMMAAGGAVLPPTVVGSAPQGNSGITKYVETANRALDFSGQLAEITRVQHVIASLKSKTVSAKFTDELSKSYTALLGQGGLLDQMSDAITRLTDRLAVNLKRATYAIDKTGNVIKKLSAADIADKTAANLRQVYGEMVKEQQVIQGDLDDVNARLKDSSLTKGERTYFTGRKREFEKKLHEVQSTIADQVEAIYQSVEDQISARTDTANATADKGTAKLDLLQRARDLVGGTVLSATGAPNNQAVGQRRADVLNTQANDLTKAADFARKRGHGDTADTIMAQVNDLRQSALEAVASGLSADVDEVNRQAGRRSTALDLRGRVASALGRVDDIGKVAAARATAIGDQIHDLSGKAAEARSKGFTALAETIDDQISELQTSLTELAAQQLADAVDQVNKAAARRSSQLDLQDRLSTLKEKAGNVAGAFADRATTLAGRASVIGDQRNALYGLLNQATAQGNQGQVEALTDQIAELDVQLQENAQAVHENTVAARQAAIDAITGRQGFLGGVTTGLQGIVTGLGALTGTTDTEGLKGLLTTAITTLQGTGSKLVDQLNTNFGIDLRGLDPAGIVKALSGLNFDAIETNMAPDDKAQFEGLINSIIDNNGAVVSNTDQLKQLNAPIVQGFTSTAWQWYRNAIFNGAGGLLPQFQAPSLSGGAHILSDGMVHVHAGEEVVAANVDRSGGSGQGDVFAPQINVTEQVENATPEVIVERLMHRYRNRPKS